MRDENNTDNDCTFCFPRWTCLPFFPLLSSAETSAGVNRVTTPAEIECPRMQITLRASLFIEHNRVLRCEGVDKLMITEKKIIIIINIVSFLHFFPGDCWLLSSSSSFFFFFNLGHKNYNHKLECDHIARGIFMIISFQSGWQREKRTWCDQSGYFLEVRCCHPCSLYWVCTRCRWGLNLKFH